MSDEDNVKDEDELGENTFGSLDFESDEVEDVDQAVLAVVDPLALEADVIGAIVEDPLDMENEDIDDADDLDDGFSDFNDYEE
jgi:hypothetical protein